MISELGKRNVGISDPGSRGAVRIEAQHCETEFGELRGGYGVSEGTDHGRRHLRQLIMGRLTCPQTLEVAFARVYNWDVAQRRKERAEAESIEGKKEASKG